MTDFLKECFARSTRPTVISALLAGANAKYTEDIKYMTDLANKSVLSGASSYVVLMLYAQLWLIVGPIPSTRRIC
jgi:hypothetical protein